MNRGPCWDCRLLAVCGSFAAMLVFFAGCAGAAIPTDQYSLLERPEEAYLFAKKAVAQDDPQAFYYCLATGTKDRFSLSELKLGWSFASGYFYVFLDSKIKDIETPAPERIFRGNPNTAKITIESHALEASFLLYREDKQWRLVFPAPYPLPDISKLKIRTRPLWRIEDYAYYNVPEAAPSVSRPIPHKKVGRYLPSLPWRSEEYAYYQGGWEGHAVDKKNWQNPPPEARIPKWRTE